MSVQVSVIIPCYNCSQYVCGAIRSALGQDDVSLEVIVLDDGSTDDTWEKLESFGESIRKYRLDRGGPYHARNFGARHAKGEWLAFLDADDEWEPNKLVTQLQCSHDDTALVYTNCRNIGDVQRVKPLQSDNSVLHEGQVFEHLIAGNFITLSSVIIRRSCFEALGGFSEHGTGIQDWDLWLRLTAEGGRVQLCQEPLTRYRHHPGQMSKQLDARFRDRLDVLRRATSLSAAHGLDWRVVRRAYAHACEVSAWQAGSDRQRAIKWHLQSACYWPFDLYPYKQIVKCLLNRI